MEVVRAGSGGRFDPPTGTVYPALHRLEGYLAELAAGLAGPRAAPGRHPARVADGLAEATAAHQAQGVPPGSACWPPGRWSG